MNYSIWNDFSFYVYLIVLIASAIVIVSSIRRLLAEEEKDVSIDFPDEEPKVSEAKEIDLKEVDINEKENIDENITPKTEEIVFKKEETIFDTQKKEEEIHSDDKAILFLKNLNENLYEIKNSINKISDLEDRLNKIENLINSFQNEVKLIIEEQLRENLYNLDRINQSFENTQEKTTPKYVMKYLQDIVDDFDLLEKEIILKRLKVIVDDLRKISGE